MKPFHYLYIVLVLGYLLLTLLAPVDAATMHRYHLSESQIRLIGLTVSIPLAAIWLTALYGYSRFQAYTDVIAKEKEGPAFKEITQGIMILALSLPASSLVSVIIRQITSDPSGTSAYATIGKSFIPMIFQLIAFTLLAAGSSKLLKMLRPKVVMRHADWVIFSMILVASLFVYLVVARPLGGSVLETYAMPAWAIVILLVVPLLYAWYKGVLAVYQLYLYQRRVAGHVYRRMLIDLVGGLAAVIITSILIQAFVSLSESLNRLNFTPLLIIVYVLVVCYAIGFGLLARGARQLNKIETA
jgi:hypothetical protein